MNQTLPPWRMWLLAALLLTSIGFARISDAYFCGYDDFFEVGRAALEDSRDPLKIITTTHFGTPKYRPLSRFLGYVAQLPDSDSAVLYRLRNLLFHLVGVAAVFGIAGAFGADPFFRFAAAALFGVHPLAHQSVAAASWTNTTAYGLMFLSLFLFLRAFDSDRPGLTLAASFGSLGLAVFAYESVITILAAFVLWAALRAWRGMAPKKGWRNFLLPASCGLLLVVGSVAAMRMLFVAEKMPLVAPPRLLMNAGLYIAYLALPVDLLLLNSLFGTPLPSELIHDRRMLAVIGGIGIAAVAGLICWLALNRAVRSRVNEAIALPEIGLAALLIPAVLSPFLLFTSHTSETYLYPAVAFFSIAVSLLLQRLSAVGRGGRIVAGVFIAAALMGCLMRSERVRACAATADRILHSPHFDAISSDKRILIAEAPGTPEQPRFGLYAYRGLSTIDTGDPGMPALPWALKLVRNDARLRVHLVDTERMASECREGEDLCFWVHADGSVTPYR